MQFAYERQLKAPTQLFTASRVFQSCVFHSRVFSPRADQLDKLPCVEDRGQTDRVTILPTLTLVLFVTLQLQSEFALTMGQRSGGGMLGHCARQCLPVKINPR